MARKVVFRPLAEADLVELDAYIAEESPERARAFVLGIKSRIMALADFPTSAGLPMKLCRACGCWPSIAG